MPIARQSLSPVFAELNSLFEQRIAIIEGPKGTMVQARRLSEADFRGQCFCGHTHDLAGDNDILCVTQPGLIEEFHRNYIEAGADMVSTNTFNGTRISQSDYQTESHVAEINRSAAQICTRAALWGKATFGRRIFVAGALGPTNRTLSLPRCQPARFPRGDFRSNGGRVLRVRPRSRRRRRRDPPRRNHLRHAQLQSRIVRDRKPVRRTARAPTGDDFRHNHRRFRTHPLRPDP
jgi:hypothetical protein